MQTPEPNRPGPLARRHRPVRPTPNWSILVCWLAALVLIATACKQDAATQAIETDANGYLCLKCGVKLYTDRAVFIGPQCPKCQQDSLMDVIGYECPKDHHLTIRPKRGDRQPLACEQCQAPLVNAMRSPREKDLKAWGATKASS
jgi:DNA-directed RNA polymerase subunit RPC12/RpoP